MRARGEGFEGKKAKKDPGWVAALCPLRALGALGLGFVLGLGLGLGLLRSSRLHPGEGFQRRLEKGSERIAISNHPVLFPATWMHCMPTD